ncbi:hypothetical protein [Streptomyces sp. NPDC016675]|uniref:hypothetical protein n=1 Tax=Streptomyces sp. NPDC016675 TaxID=3364970 RepID=UPI0036FA9412
MEVEAWFPADGEALEPVQQSAGLLHDVSDLAQALDIGLALSGDDRQDPASAQLMRVLCLLS